MTEKWETEEVLAFVYDVRPWRDLDDEERAEWCRRAKYVRANVTTDGKKWTTARLAALFGLKETGLEERFRRSAGRAGVVAPEEANKLPRRAKAEFKRAPVETQAEIVAEALGDQQVWDKVRAEAMRQIARESHMVERVMEMPEPTTQTQANSAMTVIDRQTAHLAHITQRPDYTAEDHADLAEWGSDHIRDVQENVIHASKRGLRAVANR